MKYESEEIRESVDLLILNSEEFDRFYKLFVEAILRHNPYVKEDNISPFSKLILTDGYHRAEFKVRKEE